MPTLNMVPTPPHGPARDDTAPQVHVRHDLPVGPGMESWWAWSAREREGRLVGLGGP
jgi:hypothetical protein